MSGWGSCALGFIVRVHCGLPSRATPVPRLLARLQPSLQLWSTPPARAESAFPGSDPDSVCIAVWTCFPCIEPRAARRSCRRGCWGEERKGDLGRKPGRSNDTSRFFFFFFLSLYCCGHICMTPLELFLKVMTRY